MQDGTTTDAPDREENARPVHNRFVNARFHAPDAHEPGDVVMLPPEEAEHVTRVLRLKAGDAMRVFNGRGGEFDAIVEQAGKRGVRVQLRSVVAAAPEPRVAITLAQAVLKGDKMDDVVRDSTMLGASAIQPIITSRTEVSRATLARGNRRERWERIAISSAKQCGRATVPSIAEPIAFAALIDALSTMQLPLPGLMLVEPGAATGTTPASELDLSPQRSATVVIGPEGGWAPEEIERGASACRLITVGGRILRADAMCIVALSAFFTMWREF
jgi:16S rRNA (uracil1498-N3)-methyltransferase